MSDKSKRKPKAIDYIRKGWTKGAQARDRDGSNVDPKSSCAVKWCAIGAISAVYQSKHKWADALTRLGVAIDTVNIAVWNDDPKRTKSEVLAAFRKAGI